MNRILFFIFIFLFSFPLFIPAQSLTGIWQGYFITDTYDQYRFEVQMEQSKSNTLTGVTYSYLDKRFYGKCTMTGNFSRSTSNALIQEVKTIEVKVQAGSSTCIQKCQLTYIKDGKEEFLEGTFTSAYEKTDTLFGIMRGGNCGGGKMYLRKVKTSDFYIEPFLRDNAAPKTTVPPVTNNNASVKKPVATNPVAKTPANNQKNNTNSNTQKNVVTKPKNDSVRKAEVVTVTTGQEKNIGIKSAIKTPDVLKTRQNDLVKTLTINSENITVKIYDNGEIDDDTISVYLDNQLVLSKKRLTASALIINLKIDDSNPEHELAMVAENLGRIPPNTSLMIVTAGDQRFEIRITSTEQKNAVVRFRYAKPPLP